MVVVPAATQTATNIILEERSVEEQESLDRISEAYGPRTYERLVALKNKYGPPNFFRLNPNYKPTV